MVERKLARLAVLLIVALFAVGGCAQMSTVNNGNDAASQTGGNGESQDVSDEATQMNEEDERMATNKEILSVALEELRYPDEYINTVMEALERLDISIIVDAKLEEMPGEIASDGEQFYKLRIKDDRGYEYIGYRIISAERRNVVPSFTIGLVPPNDDEPERMDTAYVGEVNLPTTN